MIDLRSGVLTDAAPPRVRLDGYTASLPIDRWTEDPAILYGQRVTVLVRQVPGAASSELTLLGGEHADGIPPGTIMGFAGSVAPPSWLIIQGQEVSRTTYARLFAVLGTTYGSGDGASTFRLPDGRGRVMVGRDSTQAEFATLGQSGGAKTHTLSTAEMPSHTHSSGEGSDGFAAHRSSTGAYSAVLPTGPSGEVMAYRQPASTGGGGSHNNLQPYLVINHIIKT